MNDRPAVHLRAARTTWPHTYGWLEHSVVPIQPAAVELLTALAGVLTRWGRWYLFGAQAVIATVFLG